MLQNGLVQVYTSAFDQMNFAPFGLSLRAAGQGLRSLIICFAPYELMEGAWIASSLLSPNLIIDHSAFEQTLPNAKEKVSNPHKIVEAFRKAREGTCSGDFDIVLLNGIHQVLNRGLLPLEEMLRLMEEKPKNVELVLSGPRASEKIIEKADLVTEMFHYVSKRISDKEERQSILSSSEVVTGDAKGKTTYCLGKAMLMSCTGVRSLVLQFIKSPTPCGEVRAIEKLPNMEIRAMGEGLLSEGSGAQRKHLEAAKQAWNASLAEVFSLKYGLIVLDEINIATYYGLAEAEMVKDMLFLKPRNLHLMLSGRKAHLEVREEASSIIEMKEIKHPFKKGIRARRGIEF